MEDKRVLDIIDEADCNVETCFIASDKALRPLGWAQKLVEIAFKAGRQEVMEWLENHGGSLDGYRKEWATQKKEWEIE